MTIWRSEGRDPAIDIPPIPGAISYFGYGSNTNTEALGAYLLMHGVDPQGLLNPRRALLKGWRIRTNYLMTSLAGAANIEPARDGKVEGVLMDITPDVHHALRRKEGHRYREINVCVYLPRSRRLILAMTYVVADQYCLTHDMPVAAHYRKTVLEGARQAGFSKKYRHYLSRLLRTA